MTHDIGIWFLLLSLFLPRITLFFWWVTGNLPYNTTPFIADIACAILVPRVLILVYIYGCMGMNAWFWIHLVVLLIVWAFNCLRYYAKSNNGK
jgi:hypothetical protein